MSCCGIEPIASVRNAVVNASHSLAPLWARTRTFPPRWRSTDLSSGHDHSRTCDGRQADMAGGLDRSSRAEAGRFEFWPRGGAREWLAFTTAFLTLAIGSIPQQDIFQRVTSAKNERTAIAGSLLGGIVYFIFVFVPIYIVMRRAPHRSVARPAAVGPGCPRDAARPSRVHPGPHAPVDTGALLRRAAVGDPVDGERAIIAPTSLCTENIVRHSFRT